MPSTTNHSAGWPDSATSCSITAASNAARDAAASTNGRFSRTCRLAIVALVPASATPHAELEVGDAVKHTQPGSTAQCDEQPSPSTVLPSSHTLASSSWVIGTTPSPHKGRCGAADAALLASALPSMVMVTATVVLSLFGDAGCDDVDVDDGDGDVGEGGGIVQLLVHDCRYQQRQQGARCVPGDHMSVLAR